MMKTLGFICALVLCAAAQSNVVHAQGQVTMRQILPPPHLPPDASCHALDVNENTQVLVRCEETAEQGGTSYVWTAETQSYVAVQPPTLDKQLEPVIIATRINSSGTVSGTYCDVNGCKPFLWSPSTGWSTFGFEGYLAYGFNDAGALVTCVRVGSACSLREADGSITELPGLFAAYKPARVKENLNNASQVLLIDSNRGEFAIWSGGEVQPLPPLSLGGVAVSPVGMNDAGMVAGLNTSTASFRYVPDEGYAHFPGTVWHINSLGHMAGSVRVNDQATAAFWRAPNDRVLLPGPGSAWQTVAHASTTSGVVVGRAYDGTRATALLWTVPVVPPTPTDRVAEIAAALDSFVSSGIIASNDVKGLLAKIRAVTQAIEKGHTAAAENVLSALRNQVQAMLDSGRITAQAADLLFSLIDAAVASL